MEDEDSSTRTLGDLLSTVDLADLLLNQLVALVADVDNLGASNAELGDLGQDLLRDLSSGLVLGEGVGVVEGVIWVGGLAKCAARFFSFLLFQRQVDNAVSAVCDLQSKGLQASEP